MEYFLCQFVKPLWCLEILVRQDFGFWKQFWLCFALVVFSFFCASFQSQVAVPTHAGTSSLELKLGYKQQASKSVSFDETSFRFDAAAHILTQAKRTCFKAFWDSSLFSRRLASAEKQKCTLSQIWFENHFEPFKIQVLATIITSTYQIILLRLL